MLSRAAAGQPAFQPLVSTRFFSFPKKYRRKRAPHKVLGVPEDATYGEIKSAYLHKAKELHPDRNPNSTEEKFMELKDAFDFYEEKEKGRKRATNYRASPPQTTAYTQFQDHTTRSDFRTHSDFMKQTMDEERKRQEYEDEEKFKDRQFMKTFVPTVIVMYTLTLARQLQFGQVQDESRPPIWKQILLHFMMDKDYTWSALKHKKHVLNRIESNAIRRKERDELERQQKATGEKHEFVRKTVNRTASDDVLAPRMHKMPIVDPSGFRDFNTSSHQSKNIKNNTATREDKHEKNREDLAREGNARSTKFRDFNATTHQRKRTEARASLDNLSMEELRSRAQKEERRTSHSPQLNFQRNSDSNAVK